MQNKDWSWKPTEKVEVFDIKKRNKAELKALRKKRRKQRKKKYKDNSREMLIKHFGLHEFASNMAICLCIHNETEYPMPDDERKAKRIIREYNLSLNGKYHNRYKYMPANKFYATQKWKELRYMALKQSNGSCALCGATSKDGVQLHVDHIKPRSRFPEMQFDLGNLQVLCSDCNYGKSNYDFTDWR